MRIARTVRVGAYVCPRGAFVITCRGADGGVEVERTFDAPFGLRTADEAAEHLVSVLQSAGIARAAVSLAVRGFGVTHHSLQLPPASDAILEPVIEREVRRLEPQLADFTLQWMALPPLELPVSGGPPAPPQRSIFATAAPADVVASFARHLRDAGHRLEHLTTLPVAVQRVLEQFDSGTGTIATVLPLPDAAYIAFSLSGGVRLVVDPPLPQDPAHEAAALAEEIDIATTFVRQQFRGAAIDRVVLIGARPSLPDLKGMVSERLRIPAKQVEAGTLTPVGFVALGAVLDAQSPDPQSLGGGTRARAVSPVLSHLHTASLVALLVLALAGFWTMVETVRTVSAERAVQVAQRQVEQEDFALASLRETASRRRMVSHAMDAMRLSAADRAEVQAALAGVASVVRAPARIDTLRLAWEEGGWRAVLAGAVEGTTNARAVQALHDFYRELPRHVPLDSLRLDRLLYEDDRERDDDRGVVRFQLSFILQARDASARGGR